MSLQNQFSDFDTKIKITREDDRMRSIREKDDSIREQIKQAFKDAGLSSPEFFQQGSYSTQTSIEPLNGDYDIDVGIAIDAAGCPDDPVEAKKVVRDVLKGRNLKDPKIKMPCVTAQYVKEGEKHFHIDYALYKKSDETYSLGIGKEHSANESRKWEDADPKGLINWVNGKTEFSSDEEHKQYKRLIRFLKRWRDFVFSDGNRKKIYSVGINIMVRRSVVTAISQDGDISDFEALRKTVVKILDSGDYFQSTSNGTETSYVVKVRMPVKPYSDVFRKHGAGVGTEFHTKLSNLRSLLDRVATESSVKTQSELLAKEAFGDDFPIPDGDGNRKFKEAGYVSSPQGAKC